MTGVIKAALVWFEGVNAIEAELPVADPEGIAVDRGKSAANVSGLCTNRNADQKDDQDKNEPHLGKPVKQRNAPSCYCEDGGLSGMILLV
jgi:hypothetical protein